MSFIFESIKEMSVANYNITIEIKIKLKYNDKNSEELLGVVTNSKVTLQTIWKTFFRRIVKSFIYWRELSAL